MLKKYLKCRGGQFSIIFAIGSMVLIMGIGGAIDISSAQSHQKKLQNAVDSAALAAASYAISESNASPGQIKLKAKEAYLENCKSENCTKGNPVTVNLDNGKVTVLAELEYETVLLQTIGMKKIPIIAQAESSYNPQSSQMHIDVYFMIDVSSSMSIADGFAEMSQLMANYKPASNPINGCAFACHEIYPGDTQTGAQIAQSLGIYTRNERVRDEVRRISEEIIFESGGKSTISLMSYGTHFRGEHISQTALKSGLDAGLSDVVYKVDGTYHDNSLPTLTSRLPDFGGEGTAENPKVIAVLVTDGVDNHKDAAGVDHITAIKPTLCQPIKDRGIELFVMNVNYPDPVLFQYNGSTAAGVTAIYDQLQPALNACASPGRYYEGKFNKDVTDAFDQILDGITEVYDATEARLIK